LKTCRKFIFWNIKVLWYFTTNLMFSVFVSYDFALPIFFVSMGLFGISITLSVPVFNLMPMLRFSDLGWTTNAQSFNLSISFNREFISFPQNE